MYFYSRKFTGPGFNGTFGSTNKYCLLLPTPITFRVKAKCNMMFPEDLFYICNHDTGEYLYRNYGGDYDFTFTLTNPPDEIVFGFYWND